MVPSPPLHIAFVVHEQGYQCILRGGRYKGDGLQCETTGTTNTSPKQESCDLNNHVHHDEVADINLMRCQVLQMLYYECSILTI